MVTGTVTGPVTDMVTRTGTDSEIGTNSSTGAVVKGTGTGMVTGTYMGRVTGTVTGMHAGTITRVGFGHYRLRFRHRSSRQTNVSSRHRGILWTRHTLVNSGETLRNRGTLGNMVRQAGWANHRVPRVWATGWTDLD